MWFGHGEAGNNFAIQQWFQVFFLVFVGAIVSEDFRIAGVWCLATENNRCESTGSQYLVHQRQF